ncbi:MAG: Rrf2 family transcriptional regulator [Candidatus Obscuribacterales bacterium]|nr:Rrf2 family transcriptional regulator [Candidatus Obscuribacterales bacterium]
MKMGQGVEWSIHCCALLAALPEGRDLKLEKIAEYYELPVPYLRKHFQALSRAGLVKTTPGPSGGYRLARSAEKISLLEIYFALEGKDPAFRCNEIRRQGPTACKQKLYPVPCNIATAMWQAEDAWRRELGSISLAQIIGDAVKQIPESRLLASAAWLEETLDI